MGEEQTRESSTGVILTKGVCQIHPKVLGMNVGNQANLFCIC